MIWMLRIISNTQASEDEKSHYSEFRAWQTGVSGSGSSTDPIETSQDRYASQSMRLQLVSL